MPKRREDVQTNANRIDWRIARHGKPVVLQIDPRHSFFVLERDRPRLPPLLKEGYKGPNNLMFIPAGSILEDRYVRVFPNHYLHRFLDDEVARAKWGIVSRDSQPYVRIYDVIDGFTYAERRGQHILASYERELTRLRTALREIEYVVNNPTLPAGQAELRALQQAVVRIQLREAEIQRILADRAIRDININFARRKAESRLMQMAATLERWASAIRLSPNQVRIGSVQQMTDPILAELPFFGSKEIRPWIGQVRKALTVFGDRTDKLNTATTKLANSMGQASAVLLKAAEILEAESLLPDENEAASADRVRNGEV